MYLVGRGDVSGNLLVGTKLIFPRLVLKLLSEGIAIGKAGFEVLGESEPGNIIVGLVSVDRVWKLNLLARPWIWRQWFAALLGAVSRWHHLAR